jgi:hypothetical protein
MAGLLAHVSLRFADLPGLPVVYVGKKLYAYSCGGSHGFGPYWVVRTVFPINPLDFIRRGTINRQFIQKKVSRSMDISKMILILLMAHHDMGHYPSQTRSFGNFI